MTRHTTTPLRRLTRTLGVIATALALVTAAAAVPARAAPDQEDVAKTLLGLLALGVVVHQLDKDDDDRQTEVRDDRRRDDRYWHDDSRRRATLPAYCIVEGPRDRRGVWYSGRCLRESGLDRRLPRDCALEVQTRRRDYVVYSERCLERAGFRPQRGRW